MIAITESVEGLTMRKIALTIALVSILTISSISISWYAFSPHDTPKPKDEKPVTFSIDRFLDSSEPNRTSGGGWAITVQRARFEIPLKQVILDVMGNTDCINWTFTYLIGYQNGDGSTVYVRDNDHTYSPGQDPRSFKTTPAAFVDKATIGLMDKTDIFYLYRDRDADGNIDIPSGSWVRIYGFDGDSRVGHNELTLLWPDTCLENEPIC